VLPGNAQPIADYRSRGHRSLTIMTAAGSGEAQVLGEASALESTLAWVMLSTLE